MRFVRGLAVLAAVAAVVGGCGGGSSVGPIDNEPEEDLLGSKRFPGQPVRLFIAAKRAFEEMEIEQTSARPDEALSGVIHATKPGDPNILVNLTFSPRGKATLVEVTIYNVRAGATAKKRLREKLFETIDKRLKRFSVE